MKDRVRGVIKKGVNIGTGEVDSCYCDTCGERKMHRYIRNINISGVIITVITRLGLDKDIIISSHTVLSDFVITGV